MLHSVYVYICYSTLKAKTYNWLPNTHTHTLATATITNKKQLGTSHRLLIIPNGHLTGADVPFVCEIPTTLTDKKNYSIFADIGLAVGMPADFDPTNLQRHVNGTKLTPSQNCGNLLLELHVSHEQCLTGISDAFSAFFTGIHPPSSWAHCTPNKSVPTLRFTNRHLLSAVPWFSEDGLFTAEGLSVPCIPSSSLSNQLIKQTSLLHLHTDEHLQHHLTQMIFIVKEYYHTFKMSTTFYIIFLLFAMNMCVCVCSFMMSPSSTVQFLFIIIPKY